jgi:hypothetical protein
MSQQICYAHQHIFPFGLFSTNKMHWHTKTDRRGYVRARRPSRWLCFSGYLTHVPRDTDLYILYIFSDVSRRSFFTEGHRGLGSAHTPCGRRRLTGFSQVVAYPDHTPWCSSAVCRVPVCDAWTCRDDERVLDRKEAEHEGAVRTCARAPQYWCHAKHAPAGGHVHGVSLIISAALPAKR